MITGIGTIKKIQLSLNLYLAGVHCLKFNNSLSGMNREQI